jgi:hypothetical protein
MGHKLGFLPDARGSKTSVWKTVLHGSLHLIDMPDFETEECPHLPEHHSLSPELESCPTPDSDSIPPSKTV